MTTETYKFAALEGDAGQRVDKWLSIAADLSRSRIQSLIAGNAVLVDGLPLRSASSKVIPGQVFEINIPPLADPIPQAENIPLDIKHEDSDLLVVNKPAGITVHPAPGSLTGTLVNALLYHAKDSLSGIGGVARPGIVHRIDKDTSGLLVVAKNDKTHQHLSNQFAKHSVNRAYICFVRGQPQDKEGRLESRLARSPQNRKKQAVVRGSWGNMEISETGRHAITNYKRLHGYGQMPKSAVGTPLVSKVECRLETGRTHQIRVHMAHSGCPLLGDPLYGRQRAFKTTKNPQEIRLNTFMESFRRQALHAKTLGFIHPASREPIEFESPLPEDLAELEECLAGLGSH